MSYPPKHPNKSTAPPTTNSNIDSSPLVPNVVTNSFSNDLILPQSGSMDYNSQPNSDSNQLNSNSSFLSTPNDVFQTTPAQSYDFFPNTIMSTNPNAPSFREEFYNDMEEFDEIDDRRLESDEISDEDENGHNIRDRADTRHNPTLGDLAARVQAKARAEMRNKNFLDESTTQNEEFDEDDEGYVDPAICQPGNELTGRWTRHEHNLFLEALKKYGKEWKKVASMVKTRTVVQTRTHAQKYFQKVSKGGFGGDSGDEDNNEDGGPPAKKVSSASKRAAKIAKVFNGDVDPPGISGNSVQSSSSKYSHSKKNQQQIQSKDAIDVHYSYDDYDDFPDRITSTPNISNKPIPSNLYPSSINISLPHPPDDFPQPSPAACGKRKQAELAVAHVLTSSSATQDIEGAQVLSMMKDASCRPGEIVRRQRTGISLTIINPDVLNTTETSATKGIKLIFFYNFLLCLINFMFIYILYYIEPGTPWETGIRALEASNNIGRAALFSSIPVSTPSEQRDFLSKVKVCLQEGNSEELERILFAAEASLSQLEKSVSSSAIQLAPALDGAIVNTTIVESDINVNNTTIKTESPVAIPKEEIPNSLPKANLETMPPSSMMSPIKSTSPRGGRLDRITFSNPHIVAPSSSITSSNSGAPSSSASKAKLNPLSKTLNKPDVKTGFTVLMYACDLSDLPQHIILNLCQTLISFGASSNTIDSNSETSLHKVAKRGFEKVGRLLLHRGCPVNAINIEGDAAIHIAARFAHGHFLEMLADLGANCHLRNSQHRSALDVAGTGTEIVNTPEGRLEMRRIMLSVEPRLRTLILYHKDCLDHSARRPSDWEGPDRLRDIMLRLQNLIEFPEYELEISTQFDKARVELLGRVHSPDYIAFVDSLSKQVQSDPKQIEGHTVPFTPQVQKTVLHQDPNNLKQSEFCDTSFSAGTLRAARRAAGAVSHAVDRVISGRNRNAFCVVRPPGHHAGYNGLLDGAKSCGFCIFNSVAAGAMHALEDHNCERVAIIDLDVHHGNGTEDIVRRYKHPSRLFFFSLHLYDKEEGGYEFFPGSGSEDDLAHNIINVPIVPLWDAEKEPVVPATRGSEKDKPAAKNSAPITGRKAYRQAITQRLVPSLRAFNPELIILSTGFDPADGDVGNFNVGTATTSKERGMNLRNEDFAWVTTEIMKVADLCCSGRVVSVLEGGYGSYNEHKHVRPTRQKPLVVSTTPETDLMNRALLAGAASSHVHRLVDPYAPVADWQSPDDYEQRGSLDNNNVNTSSVDNVSNNSYTSTPSVK
jgi:SHAQKYF class myb-like DNA-binding protein